MRLPDQPMSTSDHFKTVPKTDLDIKSHMACGNDDIIIDYNKGQNRVTFYELKTYKKLVKLQMKVDFMTFLGHGTLDVFVVCVSK